MLSTLPSPDSALVNAGPLTVHGFTVCTALGIAMGLLVALVRSRRRGLTLDLPFSVLLWAAPLAVAGGRVQAVAQRPDVFFGSDGNPAWLLSLSIGGLGAWGALAGGALGLVCAARSRRRGLGETADVVAVPTLVAVAIAVWGQWFSAERFGGVTSAPWGWAVDDAALVAAGLPVGSTVQPLFLGSSLWMLLGAVLVNLVFRPGRSGRGAGRSGTVRTAGIEALAALAWLALGYAGSSWLRHDVPSAASTAVPGTVAGVVLAVLVLVWAVLLRRRARTSVEADEDDGAVTLEREERPAESDEPTESAEPVEPADAVASPSETEPTETEQAPDQSTDGTVAAEAPSEETATDEQAPDEAAKDEPTPDEPAEDEVQADAAAEPDVGEAVRSSDEPEAPDSADQPAAIDVAEPATQPLTVIDLQAASPTRSVEEALEPVPVSAAGALQPTDRGGEAADGVENEEPEAAADSDEAEQPETPVEPEIPTYPETAAEPKTPAEPEDSAEASGTDARESEPAVGQDDPLTASGDGESPYPTAEDVADGSAQEDVRPRARQRDDEPRITGRRRQQN
jgi:prolipoprotein diacylglyceryltransferase